MCKLGAADAGNLEQRLMHTDSRPDLLDDQECRRNGWLLQMVERQTLQKGAVLMECAEPSEVAVVVSGALDLTIPATPSDVASTAGLPSPQQAR